MATATKNKPDDSTKATSPEPTDDERLRYLHYGKVTQAGSLTAFRKDGLVKGKKLTKAGVEHLVEAGLLHESHLTDFAEPKGGDEDEDEEDGEQDEEPGVLDGTVGEVLEYAANVTDAAVLRELAAAEEARDRPRVTVLEGLEKRIEALEAQGA